jgi:hypothetical protein
VIGRPSARCESREGRDRAQELDWAGIALMAVAIGALQYVLEEGPSEDWFNSTRIIIGTYVAGVGLAAFIIRELTATAPVVDLRMFRDPTFASGTFIAGVVFAMLMGSMFLLPVFTQEMMKFSATQSGIVLLPRTIAMMIASPFVGRLYNQIRPAYLVAFGLVLTAIGCWMQADINLMTSTSDLLWPPRSPAPASRSVRAATTAALSNVPRHEPVGAAGVNSFIRQVGGSIGLSICEPVHHLQRARRGRPRAERHGAAAGGRCPGVRDQGALPRPGPDQRCGAGFHPEDPRRSRRAAGHGARFRQDVHPASDRFHHRDPAAAVPSRQANRTEDPRRTANGVAMESASKDTAAATARSRRAKKAYVILGAVAAIVAGWFVIAADQGQARHRRRQARPTSSGSPRVSWAPSCRPGA